MKSLSSEAFPLSGNRLIEASAGTGKTYTITNLYLRCLLGRGSPARQVSEILVLTFTVAATEELRDRIRKRITAARRTFASGKTEDEFLQHLLDSSKDYARDRSLLAAALQLMDEAAIFSIHGFCARVLSDNAFETGTLFNQDLDADRDVLLETATEDCFRSYILTLPDFIRYIALDLWKSPAGLQQKVNQFLFRHHLTLLPPYRAVSFDQLADKIREVKRRWIAEDFPSAIEKSGLYRSRRSITQLPAMSTWCASDSLVTDLWKEWTSGNLASGKLRKGGEYPSHPLIEVIDEIHAELSQIPYNLWHDVTRVVRDNLERYKADLNQLTVDDLLAKVHQALDRPNTGTWLAQHLADRWPVAMIDEFQDTDDIQYEIFKRIYPGAGAQGLFFIGDPKQAIYQFRGADVFTYINARRAVQPDDIYSLTTNWRSTPPLVEAVNTLFDQEDIFRNDDDIRFERVQPSPVASAMSFRDEGVEPPPITLFDVAGDGLSAGQTRRMAMAYAAEETSRLLAGAARGEVLIDGEPLQARHIAFLVRGKSDAVAAREALAERDIRSVYVTLESVFLTDTAEDLKTVLQAALEPTNERALRAALAVPLMQSTAAEIDRLSSDVTAQQRLLREFSDYHQTWAMLDVATMIEHIMERREIAKKWLGKPDGDRQMTNLRHLTELLQRRAATSPGMHRLVKWFTREKLDAETVDVEERQLRLESDKNLVKIVTMHAAKGLEYEVVMIPMAAFTAPAYARSAPHLFHRLDGNEFHTFIDFSTENNSKRLADEEQLAEELRLLYVAITRARHKCYIGFPGEKADKSALSRLLRLDGADIHADLSQWLPSSLFDIRRIGSVDLTPCHAERDMASLRPPPEPPGTRSDWRLHSYTGVVRRIVVEEQAAESPTQFTPGFGDDDPETTSAPTTNFSRYSFPRGPRAGVALHTLLESLDFTRAIEAQQAAINECLDRVGLTLHRPEWTRVLTAWLSDVITTPLTPGMSLEGVPVSRRLDELEFHFPLDADTRLLGLLKAHDYLDATATLNTGVLHGMMTGLVDLVFESAGKYYLVDYKSNFLGDSADQYTIPHLEHAMRHHLYDLQYLIYCVALTRYLASRLPDYRYGTHFGGVYYLFLRGMNGKDSMTGVFHARPDEAFLAQLDATLGQGP